jgi:hypothetical protein
MDTMKLVIGDRSWPIAEDVAKRILSGARIWEDPSDTLRRLLSTASADETVGNAEPRTTGSDRPPRSHASRGRTAKKRTRARAKAGTILPEVEYDQPILEALVEAGGRAPKREVIEAVGNKLQSRFLPTDLARLGNEERWKKRAQFRRLRLVDQGFIQRGSPRGVWEITEDGRRRLKELARERLAA